MIKERTSELEIANESLKKEIVECKLTHEKLNETYKKLTQTQSQLNQASKLAAIGELAAGISHELNQPLQSLAILNASLKKKIGKIKLKDSDIFKDVKEDDFLEICKRMQFSIRRMKKIIQHVKTFSRIDIDNRKTEEIDINHVIRNSLILISQQIKNHDIELRLSLQNDLPAIKGNSQQLEQVSINMIANAIDAIGENGYIEIISFISDNKIYVQWKNSGSQIPTKNINSIFDPFFTTKDEDKGTGLGLSISYGIVKDHKGNLSVESSAEKTVFSMNIPI